MVPAGPSHLGNSEVACSLGKTFLLQPVGYFQERDGLLWGSHGGTDEPTSTRNLSSTKRRDGVPATPEQVREIPPPESPCDPLIWSRPSPFPAFYTVNSPVCLRATTLETTTGPPRRLQRHSGCDSAPHQASLLETSINVQILRLILPLPNAIHKRAYSPVGATNRAQPRGMQHWHRRSVSDVGGWSKSGPPRI